jgi:hypothetical protein
VLHDAHVRVRAAPPSETAPPPPRGADVFTVTDEFWSAELGKFREELAEIKGMPVALVMTKPLLPSPQVDVVLNIVDMTGVAPPVENRGLVAVTLVTVPTAAAVQFSTAPEASMPSG